MDAEEGQPSAEPGQDAEHRQIQDDRDPGHVADVSRPEGKDSGERDEAHGDDGSGTSTPGFRAWFRPVIAIIMIATASLGALAAYRASVAEEQTIMLKLRLSSGRMLELARWTEYAHQIATRADLEQPYRQHQRAADWLLQRADALRAKDSKEAENLDIAAQRERALQRLYDQLKIGLKNIPNEQTTAEALRTQVIAELRASGFGRKDSQAQRAAETRAAKAGEAQESAGDAHGQNEPDRLGHFWDYAYQEIARSHDKVLSLTLNVAIFVSALFAFTLADLFAKRLALALGLLCGGSAIAIVATVFMLRHDDWPWLAPVTAGLCVGFFILGVAAWRLGLMNAGPPEEGEDMKGIEPRGFHGHEMALAREAAGLSRWLVFFVAVTVLSSSVVAYLYSAVSVAASHHGQDALDYQVKMIESSGLNSAKITGGILAFATAQWLENRIRCRFDQQRGAQGSDSQGCVELKNQPAFHGDYAKAYDTDTGVFGPSRIYRAEFAKQEPRPAFMYAASDAFQEMSAAAINRASGYLAILTLFAIALYLFGQALAVGTGWLRIIFLAAGVVLLAGSDVWAYANYRRGEAVAAPSEAPAGCAIPDDAEKAGMLAAEKFANGMRLYEVASSAPDEEAKDGFRQAAEDMACAAVARPLFAMAYKYLALAYGRMDSLQWREASYESLVSRRNLPKIIAFEEANWRAMTASGLPGIGIGKPGFDYFLAALIAKTPKDSARALETSLSLVGEDASRRGDPVDMFNFGLVSLAAGRVQAALGAYKTGLEGLAEKPNWPLAMSAITDLNLLTEYCPNLPDQKQCQTLGATVARLKSGLVAGRWIEDNAPQSGQPVSISDLAFDVRPNVVEWRVKITPPTKPAAERPAAETVSSSPQKPDKADQTLAVVWYTKQDDGEEAWRVWRVQEDLSQTIRLSDLTSKQDADGKVVSRVDILKDKDVCLPPGEYKAEFFLDGRPLPMPGLGPIRIGNFQPYRSRELDAAFCYPGTKKKADDYPAELYFRIVSGETFVAGVWNYHLPRGNESDTKEAALRRAIAEVNKTSGKEATMLNAAMAFKGCAQTPAQGMPHREIVDPDGAVRVILIPKFPSIQDACVMLDSFQRYWP